MQSVRVLMAELLMGRLLANDAWCARLHAQCVAPVRVLASSNWQLQPPLVAVQEFC